MGDPRRDDVDRRSVRRRRWRRRHRRQGRRRRSGGPEPRGDRVGIEPGRRPSRRPGGGLQRRGACCGSTISPAPSLPCRGATRRPPSLRRSVRSTPPAGASRWRRWRGTSRCSAARGAPLSSLPAVLMPSWPASSRQALSCCERWSATAWRSSSPTASPTTRPGVATRRRPRLRPARLGWPGGRQQPVPGRRRRRSSDLHVLRPSGVRAGGGHAPGRGRPGSLRRAGAVRSGGHQSRRIRSRSRRWLVDHRHRR